MRSFLTALTFAAALVAAAPAQAQRASLADRVSALDGRMRIESPAGAGTRLRAEIPV